MRATATTTENDSPTLVDEIKSYKTKELIDFLREEEDLELVQEDYDIIEKERINGRDFFKITEEKFRSYGMKGGPALRLADFAKECKEKKKRPFSSYKTKKDLQKVLARFGIDGDDINKIPRFVPRTEKISDNDEDFLYCIEDIKRKMEFIGSANLNNEAVRCIYLETILLCALFIVKRKVREVQISLEPQCEIAGEEATGRADYAIKKIMKIMDLLIGEIMCVTEAKQYKVMLGIMQNTMQLDSAYYVNKKKRKAFEAFNDTDYLYGIVSTATDWYFTMYTPDRIYCTQTDYHIELTKDILEDDTDLRRGVKKVLEVIVGMLMDKISPVSKKARTDK